MFSDGLKSFWVFLDRFWAFWKFPIFFTAIFQLFSLDPYFSNLWPPPVSETSIFRVLRRTILWVREGTISEIFFVSLTCEPSFRKHAPGSTDGLSCHPVALTRPCSTNCGQTCFVPPNTLEMFRRTKFRWISETPCPCASNAPILSKKSPRSSENERFENVGTFRPFWATVNCSWKFEIFQPTVLRAPGRFCTQNWCIRTARGWIFR